MQLSFLLALAAGLQLAASAPVASIEAIAAREPEGIYTYYAKPGVAKEKEKREGIYTYYAKPDVGKEKEKREGIYTYYAKPDVAKEKDKREGIYAYYAKPNIAKEKGKRSPQDFADDVEKA